MMRKQAGEFTGSTYETRVQENQEFYGEIRRKMDEILEEA